MADASTHDARVGTTHYADSHASLVGDSAVVHLGLLQFDWSENVFSESDLTEMTEFSRECRSVGLCRCGLCHPPSVIRLPHPLLSSPFAFSSSTLVSLRGCSLVVSSLFVSFPFSARIFRLLEARLNPLFDVGACFVCPFFPDFWSSASSCKIER